MCKDMDRELKKFKDPAVENCTAATYSYKDKQTQKPASMVVQQERFQAPELYFQPQLGNLDVPALPKLVDQAILKSPIDARRRLYSSIWLSVRFPRFWPVCFWAKPLRNSITCSCIVSLFGGNFVRLKLPLSPPQSHSWQLAVDALAGGVLFLDNGQKRLVAS